MRIPEIREELTSKAARLRTMARELIAQADALDEYVQELYRRPAIKRAPVTRSSVTPELRKLIRNYAKEHPDLNNATIGRRFNVDGGRVSEALAGKRK